MDKDLIWEIRAYIYLHFAETAHSPHVKETASHFGITWEEAASAYEELQRHHAIFLKPETHDIQMAWPFSEEETPFKVRANEKTYFANCAWDSFGIPAGLRVDAEIDAMCAQTGDPIRIKVIDRQIQDLDVLVHFLIPFRNWYDDLPST